MPTALDSANYIRLMDKRLRSVAENKYKDIPSRLPEFFGMLDSDSAWEEFYEVGSLQDIPEFNGKLSYLGMSPGFHTKIEHKEYAAGVQSERKLHDDKKYAVLDNMASNLMESALRTKEKLGAEVFTDAFSVTKAYQVNEEGTALCSNSHTTKSNTSTSTGFDNLATTAISKAQIAVVRLAMRQFRNDISEHIDIGDDLKILVPEALEDTLNEILWTPKGYKTTEHTVNVANRRGYTPSSWIRLDDNDANNWFMLWESQMKKDNLFLNRISPELKNTVDFDTYMMKHAIYMRFSYGYIDWRWIYGSNVS